MEGFFRKASTGNLIKRLNPISSTLKPDKDPIAAVGYSDKRLFKRLSELNVVLIPSNASSLRFTIKFLSKFNAVKESNPSNVLIPSGPGNSLMPFWERSRNAKLRRPLIQSGTVFCLVPLKLRFLIEFSNPLSARVAKVILLSETFKVVSFRRVLNDSFSMFVMRFLEISRRERLESTFRAFTGTFVSSLSCKFRFFKYGPCPLNVSSSIRLILHPEICRLWILRVANMLFVRVEIVELLT